MELINGERIPWEQVKRDGIDYIALYYVNEKGKARPDTGRGIGMSMVIQSFDNLHDNRVLRYCADFEAHTLHMDTQTEAGEKVSVRFTGLLAHWFENVIQDNILFGMEEIYRGWVFPAVQRLAGRDYLLRLFPPAAVSRNCGSAWNGSTSGYLSSTHPLDCADLYWLRRWNCNVHNCL